MVAKNHCFFGHFLRENCPIKWQDVFISSRVVCGEPWSSMWEVFEWSVMDESLRVLRKWIQKIHKNRKRRQGCIFLPDVFNLFGLTIIRERKVLSWFIIKGHNMNSIRYITVDSRLRRNGTIRQRSKEKQKKVYVLAVKKQNNLMNCTACLFLCSYNTTQYRSTRSGYWALYCVKINIKNIYYLWLFVRKSASVIIYWEVQFHTSYNSYSSISNLDTTVYLVLGLIDKAWKNEASTSLSDAISWLFSQHL